MRRIPTEHLGAALKRIRQDRGLTQKQLAARSGLDNTNISKYESGTLTNPSWETVVAWLEACGADLARLQWVMEEEKRR